MIKQILAKIAIWICHIKYKKYKQPIFYIRKAKEDCPILLLYTEDEDVYKRWKETEF